MDRHIIVIPREKDNIQNYPTQVSGGPSNWNNFLRFSENMTLDLKKQNNTNKIIGNKFLWV